jgi:hypothetical protein
VFSTGCSLGSSRWPGRLTHEYCLSYVYFSHGQAIWSTLYQSSRLSMELALHIWKSCQFSCEQIAEFVSPNTATSAHWHCSLVTQSCKY